jgi:hypothetical protein
MSNNICINTSALESVSTDKIETKKFDEKRCAPGKNFEAGSCIVLPVLIEMVNAYNKTHKDKIKLSCRTEILKPKRYKKYLLREIKNKYKNICDGQLCWAQQDFIKNMDEFMKAELEKFTFRPLGPNGRFEWLNTLNIDEVMNQYEMNIKEFSFLGAVPMDFQKINLKGVADINIDKEVKDGVTKFGIIFNLDESWQSGSHWTAGFADVKNGHVYYFDSYGSPPEKRVIELFKKFIYYYESKNEGKRCKIRVNRTRHQFENSECGVYSINFILELLNGKSFDEITKNRIKDREVNKLRKKIFRNPNFKSESEA